MTNKCMELLKRQRMMVILDMYIQGFKGHINILKTYKAN